MADEKKSVKLPSAPTVEELNKVKFAAEIRRTPTPKKDKGK